MNKRKIDEYLRLDLQIDKEFDEITNTKNKQYKLKNEILKLGHEVSKKEKRLLDLMKQKYRLKGRVWIDLNEKLDLKNKEKVTGS